MEKALLALIPSAGVLFLFVVAIKAMLEGDRRERAAQARGRRRIPPPSRGSSASRRPNFPAISLSRF